MRDGESYGTGNGDWSRPMTVSGTNLESGMGLNRHPSSEADDFSQPLQQLRLQSSWGRLPQNGFLQRQNGMEHRQNSSPPSPPLTDEQVDMPTDPALPESDLENPDSRDTRPEFQPQPQPQPQLSIEKNGESSILTPDESIEEQRPQHVKSDEAMLEDGVVEDTSPSTATKRKARDLELFSSGSLSPPPTESIELSSPAVVAKQVSNGKEQVGTPAPVPEGSTRQTRATSEASGRRTTRSNAKTGVSSPITTPTTRGRKSMRLG